MNFKLIIGIVLGGIAATFFTVGCTAYANAGNAPPYADYARCEAFSQAMIETLAARGHVVLERVKFAMKDLGYTDEEIDTLVARQKGGDITGEMKKQYGDAVFALIDYIYKLAGCYEVDDSKPVTGDSPASDKLL